MPKLCTDERSSKRLFAARRSFASSPFVAPTRPDVATRFLDDANALVTLTVNASPPNPSNSRSAPFGEPRFNEALFAGEGLSLSTPLSPSHFKTPVMSACLVLALTAPVLVVLFFATLARFRAAFGDADPPPAPRRPFLSARSTLSATRILPLGPSRVVVDGPATRSPPSLARRGVDGSPSRVVAATGGIVRRLPLRPSRRLRAGERVF